LGCVGRIDERWSFGGLRSLAQARPDASIVLVGPVNPRSATAGLGDLLQLPNVHHFPPVAASELPDWLMALDVCLIPYEADEWQRYASPLKVWDYLYAGRPIVATGSPAMGEFPTGFVEFEQDPARLPELVAAALERSSPRLTQERRAFALSNSWDERGGQLLELVAARSKPR
jgi:glycosyltransferase involved in cell wall biosynthesis